MLPQYRILKKQREKNMPDEPKWENQLLKELRESEANLQAIVDNTNDIIASYDRDFRLLVFNEACRDVFFRFTGVELRLGMTTYDLFPKEQQNFWIANNARVLTGKPFSAQFSMSWADGTKRFYESFFNPIRRDNEIVGFSTFTRDISERRRAEEALRESEANLQAIIESTDDIVASYDRDIRLLVYNQACSNAYQRVFGAELHPGMHTLDLFPKEQRSFWQENNARVLAGEAFSVEFSERATDGSLQFFESMFSPIRRAQEIVGFSTFTRDITERRRTEEALRENEKRFRLLVQNSNDVIEILDPNGKPSYISDQITRILGYQPKELVGVSGFDYLHPDDRQTVTEIFTEGLKQPGAVRKAEFRFRHKDGNWVDIEAVGCNLMHDPAIQGIVLNIRDVTERIRAEREQKKLQDQLQQAMKMEAIGRLAGGIAHDFNNLLTGMSGNVQLALMDLKPDNPLAETLREIGKAADSAATLTRQLLAFSRKQLIEPKLVDLNEMITSTHKMLKRLIGEDIELHVLPGKNLGAVKIDRAQFEQILVNLAINARDAMPNGGQLTIEAANVELDEGYCHTHADARLGRFVMLAVSDTGIGMNDEVKAHLFEPFFTTKEKGKGTGLGLATIYGTVKQAGGSIEVYSEAGKGTAFKIYLPRMEAHAGNIEKSRSLAEMPRGSETVLLVEDEEMVRHLAIRVLRRLGYEILHAGSGGDALAAAKQYAAPIHLLFTDVVMPGMNGRQLSERIAAIHPETKVLYSSGFTENAIAHHGVIDEGLNFIGKPYTPHSLAKAIRAALDD
jgi:PAS domain S-box-containing protein